MSLDKIENIFFGWTSSNNNKLEFMETEMRKIRHNIIEKGA